MDLSSDNATKRLARINDHNRKKLKRWPKEFTQRTRECFPELDGSSSAADGLVIGLSNANRPFGERASLAHIAVHGRYPEGFDLKRIELMLRHGSPEQALQAILDLKYKSARSARRRTALRVSTPLIDVSKFVNEYLVSGIPRVVKNALDSKAFADAVAFVWDDGAPCPTSTSPLATTGSRITFDRASWRSPHNRMKQMGRIWLKLTRQPWAIGAVGAIARRLGKPITGLAIASRKPRQILLLDKSDVLILEVPSRESSSLLQAAKTAFPDLRVTFLVHDFLPITHPEFFVPMSSVDHLAMTRLVLACDQVIVYTSFIEEQVAELARLTETDCPPVHQLALPDSLPKGGDEASPTSTQPYFLFIGGYDPRKGLANLHTYLTAIAPERVKFKVVVLGTPQPVRYQIDLFQRISKNPGPFELRSQVSDEELARLKSHASAILYPSFAEGFGLPIIEASGQGVPVLVRDTPTNRWLASTHPGVDLSYSEDGPELIEKLDSLCQVPPRISGPRPVRVHFSIEEWADRLRQIVSMAASESPRR